MTDSPIISEAIKNNLSELETKEEEFISAGRNMLSGKDVFPFDLYCTAILNRSLNLVRGVIALMKDKNFIAAAPLIRVHLDTLLRLYAFSLMDQDIDSVVMQIIKGIPMRKLKSRDGLYLKDSYLVESISRIEQFNWVAPIYDKLNGFVHLSDMHILASSKLNSTDGIIQGTISRSDDYVPEDDKLASISFMIMISDGIVSLVSDWIEKKETYKRE